jgi:hypothetical protein
MSTTGATADPLAALGRCPAWPSPWSPCARPWTGSTGTASCGAAATRSPPRRRCAARAVPRRCPVPTGRSKRCAGAPTSAATTRPVVGAALRLTAEAGQLLSIWRQSPLGYSPGCTWWPPRAREDAVGRPRREHPGESADEPLSNCRCRSAAEVSGRLDGLADLIIAGGSAPALVTAAVVHGELLALRPFTSHNGLVARAAERIVLVGSGLDPKSVCPAEVGHAELGRAAYWRRSTAMSPAPRRAWPPGSPTAAGRSNWARGSRRRCARRFSAGPRRTEGRGMGPLLGRA